MWKIEPSEETKAMILKADGEARLRVLREEEDEFTSFKKALVGRTIVKVIQNREEYGEITYILVFDNGLRLTAEDGEYGDNAFRFFVEGEPNVG